ncbi:hypothetical protein GM3708_3572 (plasmid) [Geminocystis sp. NIES-3708]|uniref:hypothetical protein n=1 Tax=Geminocystis sp. NIES-3708 TaxID=1615909 RepID=UPI0005FC84A4|nr:hypothetical protein [Geminocystis sp. NIES-3708]BAQ63166.1 hypothetical protein GM3708_3572 [Geminocystis sp. NIES-3708]
MAKNFEHNQNVWTKIEVHRMEFFLLIFENIRMHPSVFLNKWRGIKVSELAELLGVEDSKIYLWCSPKKPNISEYYLLKIALLDIFFEHFENIPDVIWKRLMS